MAFFRPALLPLLTVLFFFASDSAASVTDSSVQPPPNYYTFQPPPAGGTYTDPVFGSSIRRISNAPVTPNADGGGTLTFIVNEYSSMSAFNSDNSRLLAVHQSYIALYDGQGSFLKNLSIEVHAGSEPRWSRTDPDVLYYLRGNALKQYNVTTGAISTVRAFAEYSSISGRGESDICFDGKHFVLVGNGRYVFVYDVSAGTRSPVFDTGGRAFDGVHITPNDNVTITWLQSGSNRYNGIELFDRNMVFQRQVARAGGHMDVTRDASGAEFLVWTNSADPQPACGQNAVVKVRLSDGQQTCLLSLDWSLAVHISAPDISGSVLVGTYAPADPAPASTAWAPYTNELLQVRLDGAEVRRLAHHRSRPFNSYNYSPKPSVSRDGTRLIYSSNYSLQSILGYPVEYSDVYMLSVEGAATSGGDSGGGTTTDTTTTRIEQDNAVIQYSGGAWYSNTLSQHSGGTAVLTMDAGSRATLTFNGTGIRWIAYRDEWAGIARVYLDGALQTTVNTYASPQQSQAVMFERTGLPAGTHTIAIEVTGEYSGGSAAPWVWVDAFEVITASGSTESGGSSDGSGSGDAGGSETPPPAPVTVRLEQTDPGVTYAGAWSASSGGTFSGGTAASSSAAGSRATVTFTGTAVSWIGRRDDAGGIALVYLDGVQVARVDTNSKKTAAQAVLYSTSGLSSGAHTLAIEVTGDSHRRWKGPASIWVDAFDVTR